VSTHRTLTVRAMGAAGLALALTACGASSGSSGGSSSGETVAVDVGTDTPVQLPEGPLRVGIFMNAQSNQWQQNLAESAKETAESYGWEATVLEFNFDQQAMSNALLNAATSHSYDAIAVTPIDGQASCQLLTETLPQANVLVTVGGTTVCGRDLETGDEMWAPGTLSYHSVAPSADYARAWLENTIELFPGPQKVALVVGPEQNGNTILMHQLAEEFAESNPDFQIRDFINTDYTTPTTVTAVQGYLQANPDTTLVLSVYSPDLSRGVVQALEAQGLAGQIPVSDMGGAQYSVDQIRAGNISLTMPYYPVTSGANMIEAIKNAQDGETPVRVVDEIPGGLENAPVVTQENVDSFDPQY
jgi:ribose transport system substrate-binding protein